MQDTATVCICRCGWVGISPNFGVSTTAYFEHKGEFPETTHDPRKILGVSNPITPDAINEFKRIAHVEACESIALDNLENWKSAPQPERVQDDGLGTFRGMWSVIKGWLVVGVVALCAWGLWRLA